MTTERQADRIRQLVFEDVAIASYDPDRVAYTRGKTTFIEAVMTTTATDKEIDVLYATWADAFRRKDADAVFGLLTPDYVLLRSGAPPMTADAIRPALLVAFASFDIVMAFEREERIVSGDLAFEQGWDVQTLRPTAGGEGRTQRQHVALLLRRGSDGAWRFARGMVL